MGASNSSHFHLLPQELLQLIFSHLGTRDQYQCSAACKYWRDTINSIQDGSYDFSDVNGAKQLEKGIRYLIGRKNVRDLALPKLADASAICSLMQRAPWRLECLSLKETPIKWPQISKMGVANLTELCLDNCQLRDNCWLSTMEEIVMNTWLSTLSIKNEENFYGYCMRQLPVRMKVLNLHNVPQFSAFFLRDGRKRNLERFSWTGRFVLATSIGVPDGMFDCPTDCPYSGCVPFPQLQSLCTPFSYPNTLYMLPKYAPRLEELRINIAGNVPKNWPYPNLCEEFIYLMNLEHLEHLELALDPTQTGLIPDRIYIAAASGGTLRSLSIYNFPQDIKSLLPIIRVNPELSRLGLDYNICMNEIYDVLKEAMEQRIFMERLNFKDAIGLILFFHGTTTEIPIQAAIDL